MEPFTLFTFQPWGRLQSKRTNSFRDNWWIKIRSRVQRRAALVHLPRNPKQSTYFPSNLPLCTPSVPHLHRSLRLPFHSAPLPPVTTATGEEGVGRTWGGWRGGKQMRSVSKGQVNLGTASLWCGEEELWALLHRLQLGFVDATVAWCSFIRLQKAAAELGGTTNLISLLLRHLQKKTNKTVILMRRSR